MGETRKLVSPARVFARPTADEIWLGPAQQAALSHLCHPGQIRVIVGPTSSGKTTLLQHLGSRLHPGCVMLQCRGAQESATQVLASLLLSADLAPWDLSEVEQRNLLTVFLQQRRSQGRRVVLLVDDAHHFKAGAVVIPDIRGEPPNGKANWTNGFLPAQHQAVMMSAQQPVRNLAIPDGVSQDEERATRHFLRLLNEKHAAANPGLSELRARVNAYELAGRMQLSAPEVADLDSESAATHRLYGTHDANSLKAAYARNCLLARRLIERGVRYVNLYCASRASGVDGLLNWDAHKTLRADYDRHCPIFDEPTAALLTDLKQRGLLDETLVLWTTEFGRMPTHQEGVTGRDHNPDGFTCWMMGAGVRGGVAIGSTDEFGRRAQTDPVTVWDFYATVLHLLGLDHTKVTYYHNGLDRRLTDVHGNVLRRLLA